MSDGRKYYCYCDSNCKFETMTKEQILAAITQAVETGTVSDVDTGFVTRLKETNGGSYVTVWVGTQAQYNALAAIDTNCLYIITDDTTTTDFAKATEDFAAANEAFRAHLNNHVEYKAFQEHLNDHIEVEIVQPSEGNLYKKYSNGIAEGWWELKINEVPITTQKGALYCSPSVRIPYPDWLVNNLAYDLPQVCEVAIKGSGNTNEGLVFLMQSGQNTATATQMVTFTGWAAMNISVTVQLHFVWWWKKAVSGSVGGSTNNVGSSLDFGSLGGENE